MKRYVRIGTACVVIVALMVDSVAACWLFSRRAYCRPCPPPPCYSAPVVYSSCDMGGAGYSTLPGAAGSMSRPSMRIPWAQPLNGGASRQPTPAETRPSSPSDRPSTFRETTPEPMPQPPRGTEPMPEPPQSTPDTSPPAPSTPAPGDTAAPPAEETTPTPGAADLDNPFRPTTPAEGTDSALPTERTVPDADPFPPRPPADGATTPSADPFAPSNTTPPTEDALPNPFGQPPSSTNRAGTTNPAETQAADSPMTPRSPATPPSDSQPALDNPFGAPPSTSNSTPNDPFAPVGDTSPAPTDGAGTTPTSTTPTTPMSETNDAAPPDAQTPAPAVDDPFAEPAGPRLSVRFLEPEPANALRVWTDVTGKHQVRGRMKLILTAEQKVRILKETGKYTTVPFAKLSEADRMFVARYAIEPSTLLAERH